MGTGARVCDMRAQRSSDWPLWLNAVQTQKDMNTCATHEAGGHDDAVHLQLLAVDDHTLRCNALDALAAGIHQRDALAVEGVQVVVVEARPLAELLVVGLEGLGRLRILQHTIIGG